VTIPYIPAQDATRINAAHIPAGTQAMGYSTGSGDVPWATATFAAHAKPYPAVHIDQDAAATDATADVLDVESLAATVADIPGWIRRARANYAKRVRPSQRWPAVYCSMGTLPSAIAILTSNSLVNVPFITTEPGNTEAYAIQRVTTATGPYPCVGCQYQYGTYVDYDILSLDWMINVAGEAGTQVNWKWCNKCQGMFYAPNESKSVCPKGGTHNGSTSYNYALNFTT
jgi:hypothetical protein